MGGSKAFVGVRKGARSEAPLMVDMMNLRIPNSHYLLELKQTLHASNVQLLMKDSEGLMMDYVGSHRSLV